MMDGGFASDQNHGLDYNPNTSAHSLSIQDQATENQNHQEEVITVHPKLCDDQEPFQVTRESMRYAMLLVLPLCWIMFSHSDRV